MKEEEFNRFENSPIRRGTSHRTEPDRHEERHTILNAGDIEITVKSFGPGVVDLRLQVVLETARLIALIFF